MVLGWDVHLVRRMLGANDTGQSRPSTHIERDGAWSQILASLEAYPAVHAKKYLIDIESQGTL